MQRIPHPYPGGHLVIVLDCENLARSAEFWTRALGYAAEGPPAGQYQSLIPASGSGIEIMLQQVPELKAGGKNRLHLDLRTTDLDAEVGRLTGLGARVLTAEPVTEDGWRWHILADPDGNELCVLQPAPAYWA